MIAYGRFPDAHLTGRPANQEVARKLPEVASFGRSLSSTNKKVYIDVDASVSQRKLGTLTEAHGTDLNSKAQTNHHPAAEAHSIARLIMTFSPPTQGQGVNTYNIIPNRFGNEGSTVAANQDIH